MNSNVATSAAMGQLDKSYLHNFNSVLTLPNKKDQVNVIMNFLPFLPSTVQKDKVHGHYISR